jgi:hypothetical protein
MILLPQEVMELSFYDSTRSLAGAGIGARTLTTHRQTPAVTQTSVTPEIHQSFDIECDLPPQIPFDLIFTDLTSQSI